VVSAVATYAIIRLTDRCVGVNISIETELQGLDKMEIGEVAYGLDDDEDDDKLCMKLCELAAAGDLLEIKRFYRFHHSLDFKDYDDRGALHIAAAEGHLEVCKFLVKKGLDVNNEDKYSRKPIVDALFKGHRDVVIFLKQEGTKIDLSKYADRWFMAIVSQDKGSIQCYIAIGISADT
jgi:ankyrin repeat protein